MIIDLNNLYQDPAGQSGEKAVLSSPGRIYGNKAAGLGKLISRGFHVPAGYAISVDMFYQFLDFNEILFKPEEFLARNETIRQKILAGSFPGGIEPRLQRIFTDLMVAENTELAVRSSALCEDAGRTSFAGIFETYTGIQTAAAMISAIKKCYASLLSDRALVYALKHQVSFSSLVMGLIVQQFVRGRPSGVMFTADPVTMEPGTLVINWVDSICADYVNGSRASRQIKLDKEQEPDEDREGLTAEQLAVLAAAGRKCEQLMGTYQDLEWTFAGDRLYLLQSRPVTGFKNREFPVTWQNENDKEFTWYKSAGPLEPLEQEKILYLAGPQKESADKAGLSFMYFESMFQNGYMYWRHKDLPDADKKREEYNAYVNRLKDQGKNIFSDIYLPRILEIHTALERFAGEHLTNAVLCDYIDEACRAMEEIWRMHWLIVQGCLEQDTVQFFREEFGLRSYETSLLLHQETWHTRYHDKLMQMNREIRKHGELNRIFRDHSGDEIIYAHLLASPAAGGLLDLLAEFLRDYGLYQFDWNDNRILEEYPPGMMGRIMQVLDTDPDTYFLNKKKKLTEKVRLEKTLPARLGSEKWDKLRQALPFYRKSYLVRDNHGHYIDATACGFYRRACLLAGRRLAEQGRLKTAGEIFFLYREEIKQALTGNLTEPALLAGKRRQNWEQQQQLLAPPRLGKAPPRTKPGAEQQSGSDNAELTRFKGYAGLAEIVRAEVRFIKDLAAITRGKYIFVFRDVREIDPNIILKYACGLVFNGGSPFDHIGIWAREYNIPTLFGIGRAAEILETGDVVELDGINEELRLLSRCKRVLSGE